eukprot:670896-Rhodomonas_salina.9
MPEQIWGIVQNFVIGKYDPKHPNFKMTSIELKIQKELNCGLNGKIHKAKIAVKEFRDLLPVIKRGDIPGTMNGIVANPKLLIALNVRVRNPGSRPLNLVAYDAVFCCVVCGQTVKPNCINVMMRRLFLLPPIQEALETVGAALPVVSTPVAQLKACKWDSAVAFRQGMDAMAAIKDSLEASLQSLRKLISTRASAWITAMLGTSASSVSVSCCRSFDDGYRVGFSCLALDSHASMSARAVTLKDGDFVKALGNLLGSDRSLSRQPLFCFVLTLCLMCSAVAFWQDAGSGAWNRRAEAGGPPGAAEDDDRAAAAAHGGVQDQEAPARPPPRA